jgi:hypothetical protein
MDTPISSSVPGYWVTPVSVPWMVYQVHPPTPSSWITYSLSPSVVLITPRTSN